MKDSEKTYYTYRIRIANLERVQIERRDPENQLKGEPSGDFQYEEAQIKPLLEAAEQDEFQDEKQAQLLGEALFNTLFDPTLRQNFVNFYQQVVHSEKQLLRVELDIDEQTMPAIAALPWEFMCLPESANLGTIWLGTDPNIVFSRRRNQWHAAPSIQLKAGEKLRIALVVSAPENLGSVVYEKAQTALEKLVQKQPQQIELLPIVNPATPDAIDRVLGHQPHIFHFIGHGRFQDETGEEVSEIALFDGYDQADWINSHLFSNLFARHQPGVVLLQACEGGKLSNSQAFVGIASRVVQENIPVVVAMQYEISNSTASHFACRFYEGLAQNEPVDSAAQNGRHSIALKTQYRNRDFATPVIFMRVNNGYLFKRDQVDPEEAFFNSLKPKYEIDKIKDYLGTGNLAKLYKATDKDMERVVSIKFLNNPKLVEEFKETAKRAVRLSDEPHFLTIYDLHLEGDPPYYSRQYIAGESLRTHINRHVETVGGGLALDKVLKIVTEVGQALNRAHELSGGNDFSYSYTDTRPSNILISEGNNPQTFISSFNICARFQPKKIISELEGRCVDKENLAYLLPDHFYGSEINYNRSDQYLLGILAYELLTGKMPETLKNFDQLKRNFNEGNKQKAFNTFEQIEAIPRPDCPDIVKTVILRMVKKDPEERYNEFNQAFTILSSLDINLTMVKDSYYRCMESKLCIEECSSKAYSQENFDKKFFEVFLKELENDTEYPDLSKEVYNKLSFKGYKSSEKRKERHASSLTQSILFLFAYYEQNERFYRENGKKEPNILSSIAKTHNEKHHNIPEKWYKPFKKALINTIEKFDQKGFEAYHPVLKKAWEEIYDSAKQYMVSKHKTSN